MSKFWHGLFHVGMVALQVANTAIPFIPPPFNLIVTAVLGGVQGGVAIYNHEKPSA